MKRVFLHVKRLFRKFWFFIFFVAAMSPFIGLGVLIILTIISMIFFSDPVDVDNILDNFTEEELELILSEDIDESVSDDDYLQLIARYQSCFCPKAVDELTIWTGSEVSSESFIFHYEIKREIEGFSQEKLKEDILANIDKGNVHTIRLVRSGRNMVFRYTYRKSNESFEIVINNNELVAA